MEWTTEIAQTSQITVFQNKESSSHMDQQKMADNKEKFKICLAREQTAYAKSLAEAVSIINFHLIILRLNFNL